MALKTNTTYIQQSRYHEICNLARLDSDSERKALISRDSRAQGKTIQPVVLLSRKSILSLGHVKEAIHRFLQIDDVFSTDFLTDTVIVQQELDDKDTHPDLPVLRDPIEVSTETNRKICRTYHLEEILEAESLPEGPYFLVGSELHQAWRLYADHVESFLTTVVPSPTTSEG